MDSEIHEYQGLMQNSTDMSTSLKEGILQMFDSTGTNTDEYLALTGSSNITNHNMMDYLGAFEAKLDDLLQKDDFGVTCDEIIKFETDSEVSDGNEFVDSD